MGTRGPLPDPNSSESARGRNTLGHRITNDPTAKPPKCPSDLGDAAKAFWKAHAKSLHAKGYLNPDDLPAFVQLCRISQQLVDLDSEIARTGLTVTSDTGVVRSHPSATLRVSVQKNYFALLAAFGMSPMHRQRVPEAIKPKNPRLNREELSERVANGETLSQEELSHYYFGDDDNE